MEPKELKNRKEYLDAFSGKDKEKITDKILDIRKYEIDLYWKRATYFWTFIGATFGGYLTIGNISNADQTNLRSLFLLIVLGVIFSICWYFVNRGSKFWQLNWEKHLDVMEDESIGPLYKTTIYREYYSKRIWKLNGPYPFSVSKINILLSLFVFILWVIIYSQFIISNFALFYDKGILANYFNALNLLLFIGLLTLFLFGRTGKFCNDEYRTYVHFKKRGFKEKEPEKSEANENG